MLEQPLLPERQQVVEHAEATRPQSPFRVRHELRRAERADVCVNGKFLLQVRPCVYEPQDVRLPSTAPAETTCEFRLNNCQRQLMQQRKKRIYNQPVPKT